VSGTHETRPSAGRRGGEDDGDEHDEEKNGRKKGPVSTRDEDEKMLDHQDYPRTRTDQEQDDWSVYGMSSRPPPPIPSSASRPAPPEATLT
jgi:hypothetical protein